MYFTTSVAGRWLPPWTVTSAVWHKAMKSHVSGVSTDVLFLVRVVRHWCTITGCSAVVQRTHPCFTIQAVAEARWESNRLPIRRNQLPASPDTLRSIRPRDPDDESPLVPEMTPRHHRLLHQSSSPQDQLRPMFRPGHDHVLSLHWSVTCGTSVSGASSIRPQGFCAGPYPVCRGRYTTLSLVSGVTCFHGLC